MTSSAECGALEALFASDRSSMVVGLLVCVIFVYFLREMDIFYSLRLLFESLFQSVPTIDIEIDPLVASDAYKSEATPPASTNIRDKKDSSIIHCFDPATRDYLGTVPAMTPNEVRQVVEKARKAQESWSQTTFAQRRAVLRSLQKYCASHVRELCRAAARDSGKPIVDACLGEVLTTCEKIRCVLAHGQRWLRPSHRPTGPVMMHKSAVVEYVPYGVIGAIAPWNYPLHNFINHAISGLMAGNAVVTKVSEHASWSAHVYFAKIVRAALEVNGFDGDICGLVTGFGEAGAALVKAVDKVVFTGSPAVGRLVMRTAAETLTPVILELGGKDAMVVMDDANLPEVIPWIMRGCFQNCGQNCVGIERVIVFESVHDELVDKIVPLVKALRQGPPLATCSTNSADIDCGALVMREQMDIIQDLVDDAVKKGAKILCGGKYSEGTGHFYPPTVLTGVTESMCIFATEVFGPVMTICKASSQEECVRMVNGTSFGLGASVYGKDAKRALEIGRQIRSGMVCVNDFGSNYLVQALPFGGVGESGFGRFAGPEGLRALCLERAVLTDRIPGVKTSIPPPLQYPIDKEKGFNFCESLIWFFYDGSLMGTLKGILGLIQNG